MTARLSRPVRAPVAAVVGAVVVAAELVIGTLLTWHTTVSRDRGPEGRPAWTSGAWAATGATLAVLGVVLLLIATCYARTRVTAAGAVLAVAGAVTLLAEHFRPTGPARLTAVTVAVARFDTGPNPLVGALPDASAWITAGGLGVLVVAGVALPARRPRRTTARAVVLLLVVGALALVVGGTAFPWSVGVAGRAFGAVPVWRANAGGASLVVLAAVATGVALWRQVRGAAVTAGLLAAAGLGLLLIDRLPNPWGARATGWSAYQPLESIEIPAGWRFQAATSLVLFGAVLVLVAAVLAARRPVAPVRAVV